MAISLILDIAVVVIALVFAIKYGVNGLFKSVLDLLKLVVSVVLAFALRGTVGDLVDQMFMNQVCVNWVAKSLNATAIGQTEIVDFATIYTDAPDFYNKVLAKFGIQDVESLGTLFERIANGETTLVDEVSQNIGSALSSLFSTVIAVVAVFVVALIVMSIVVRLLNLLTKFSGVRFFNALLGIAFGLAIALLIDSAVCYGLHLLINVAGPMYPDVINDGIFENSYVLKIIDQYNILEKILQYIKG